MSIEKLAIVISGIDSTGNMFKSINDNVKKMKSEFGTLWSGGKKFEAFRLGLGKIGSFAMGGSAAMAAAMGIHSQIAKLASAQDSFNMVQNLTGKTAEEMKHFRAQIYQTATETGRSVEEILDSSVKAFRRKDMTEPEIFESLKNAGKYATATHSKNLAQIADATHVFARQMKVSVKEASNAFAGVMHISKNGIIDFETLMGSATSMLGEASSMGVGQKKGIMQIMAAAEIAAKDTNMGGEAAIASVQSLFADMKTAKQDKALEAAGLGIDEFGRSLQERAEQSGDYIATVVKEVMAKTNGDEVALAKIFKSKDTRNLIRSMYDDMKKEKSDYRTLYETALMKSDGSHNEADEDHKRAMKSIGAQWKNFQNQMLQVGDNNIAPLLNRLSGIMEFFTKNTWAANIAVKGFLGLFIVGAVSEGAKAWFDKAKNPSQMIADGKLTISYKFLPPAPLEHLTYESCLDVSLAAGQ